MATRVLGLFGGTFDPPHLGHVAAARAAIAALGLDELVVTVAADPQGKPQAPTAPAALRLEMAEAAFAGIDRVVVSDLELRRGGPTYTIDTVVAMKQAEPAASVVLVVGADAAAGLARWHRAAELSGLVSVAVVPRRGPAVSPPEGFSFREVAMAPVDLSSTGIRAALAAGEDPSGLLPAGVIHIALANRLYSP